jgi:hypothetical protein
MARSFKVRDGERASVSASAAAKVPALPGSKKSVGRNMFCVTKESIA